MKQIAFIAYVLYTTSLSAQVLSLDDEIERVNSILLDSLTLEEIVDRAMRKAPYLKASEIELKKKEVNLKIVRKSWLRDLRFGINFFDVTTSAGENQQTITSTTIFPNMGMSLSMSPETFVNRRNNVKTAKLEYQMFSQLYQNEKLSFKMDIVNKYYSYLETLKIQKILEKEHENGIQQLMIVEERFKQGELRVESLLDAQKGLRDLEQQLIKNKTSLLKSRSELNACL